MGTALILPTSGGSDPLFVAKFSCKEFLDMKDYRQFPVIPFNLGYAFPSRSEALVNLWIKEFELLEKKLTENQ